MTNALARTEDPSLDLVLSARFADCWGAIENALRRSAIADWEVGTNMAEIRKARLFRYDPRFLAAREADPGIEDTFDAWVEHVVGWSVRSVVYMEQLAREFDRKAIESRPDLTRAHWSAMVEGVRALPPSRRAEAKRRALEALPVKGEASDTPSAADTLAAAQDAAAEVAEESGLEPIAARPRRVNVDRVYIAGHMPAEPEGRYVSAKTGKAVKRLQMAGGKPVLAGLRLRVALDEHYELEIDLDRVPAVRVAPRSAE